MTLQVPVGSGPAGAARAPLGQQGQPPAVHVALSRRTPAAATRRNTHGDESPRARPLRGRTPAAWTAITTQRRSAPSLLPLRPQRPGGGSLLPCTHRLGCTSLDFLDSPQKRGTESLLFEGPGRWTTQGSRTEAGRRPGKPTGSQALAGGRRHQAELGSKAGTCPAPLSCEWRI